mgnify:CR=1 FL=1
MAIKRDGAVLRQVGALFNVGVIRDLTDGQLLERFANDRGEAAELAFAALVDRHGAMVLRVCRARLADSNDALDAFQATFLILIEKAPGLWVRDSLGPWLHAVAHRTATRARSAAARRRQIERGAADRSRDQDADRGLEQALHEEIDRLPERYRVPIILCDLEGRTCEDVARKMGRPVGTVKSWRARGRERLRQRLTRAGLAPSVGLPTWTTPEMNEAIRAALARLTAGTVPASVGMLVKGALKAMLLKKLGTAAVILGALAFAAAGVGSLARVAADDPKEPRQEARIQAAPAPPRESDDETWSLSLREAIRIGLENSDEVRVVATSPSDAALTIAPRLSKTDDHQFKAEVMAIVRLIQERYWSLSKQYVGLWAAEKAVQLAEESVDREQADLKDGRGAMSDVAEAQQRLDQFKLDMIRRTSDVITSGRLLRGTIGLATSGRRRIMPSTPPVEARLEPQWEACFDQMLRNQPDVVRAKEHSKIHGAELDAVIRNFIPDLEDHGAPSPVEAGEGGVESSFVKQTVDQATNALNRFFFELDGHYKQYETAKKLRSASEERLDAQRAFYEKGRITIDRYLDAVSQYATAVAQEAEFKAAYNVTIVNLEEAKGTLLEHDEIALATRPRTGETDTEALRSIHLMNAPAGPESPRDAVPAPPSPTVAAEGRTTTFKATIQIGAVPIEIRGSFTVGPEKP